MKTFTIFLFSCLSISLFSQKYTDKEIQKAKKLHENILSLDSHTDTPLRLIYTDNFNLGERHDPKKQYSKLDFPRMREGKLDAVFFAVFLGQGKRDSENNKKATEKAYETFNAIFKSIDENKEIAEIALNPEDALKIKNKGKSAIYIGIENGYAIGNDTSLISKYYKLGARYITLCHTKNNDICDSSTDSTEHHGLSSFGKTVVKKMNEIGMMIDVSHISDEAFYDVIKLTKTPVIASHSCARAICDNPRNLTDDMLKKLAKNGGVIQMCILSDYVKTPEPNPERDSLQNLVRIKYRDFIDLTEEEMDSARIEWYAIDDKYPKKLANVVDVVNHIDHIVKIAGIDHVGIGTDFDGGGGVEGCFDVSEMYNITIELLRRGYSEKDLKKIWSGNFMRVFKEVQKLAKS